MATTYMPHVGSLQKQSDVLKANASSVPPTVGGGAFGRFGLLVSIEKCRPCRGTHSFNVSTQVPISSQNLVLVPVKSAYQDWRASHYTIETCCADWCAS